MNMTKRSIKNYCLLALLTIYMFLYRFFVYTKLLKYNDSVTAAFMIILLSMSILFLGYRKILNSELKNKFIVLVVAFVFLYFVGTYGLGLALGFLSNSYSLRPYSIFNNTFSVAIIICATEIFRYVFISANRDKKAEIVLLTFLLTLFEINLYITYRSFLDLNTTFKFIVLTILPISMRNIMCSYLTYYAGYVPSLIYRLIIGLYFYIVPIQPDLGDYLISIITLGLPFIIVMYASRIIYNYKRIKEHEFGKKIVKLSDIPILVAISATACLIFGVGPFKLIGIETGSMTPNIKIGDAVVIEKKVNLDKLQEGDIVAYLDDKNKVIVHRIIKVNSDNTFITKGDFNNTADSNYVKREQIKGKVKFKIPYIAYPAIMFK